MANDLDELQREAAALTKELEKAQALARDEIRNEERLQAAQGKYNLERSNIATDTAGITGRAFSKGTATGPGFAFSDAAEQAKFEKRLADAARNSRWRAAGPLGKGEIDLSKRDFAHNAFGIANLATGQGGLGDIKDVLEFGGGIAEHFGPRDIKTGKSTSKVAKLAQKGIEIFSTLMGGAFIASQIADMGFGIGADAQKRAAPDAEFSAKALTTFTTRAPVDRQSQWDKKILHDQGGRGADQGLMGWFTGNQLRLELDKEEQEQRKFNRMMASTFGQGFNAADGGFGLNLFLGNLNGDEGREILGALETPLGLVMLNDDYEGSFKRSGRTFRPARTPDQLRQQIKDAAEDGVGANTLSFPAQNAQIRGQMLAKIDAQEEHERKQNPIKEQQYRNRESMHRAIEKEYINKLQDWNKL